MSGRCEKWIRPALWSAAGILAAAVAWYYSPAAQTAPVTAGPAAGQYESAVLDVNAAGTGALEELPGIGPALAERIVGYRTEHGSFGGPEALMDVPGIGPATWADIEPFVYFGER